MVADRADTPASGASRRRATREDAAAAGPRDTRRQAGAEARGRLCLWYDRPAETWMTEALPIGNGPMGAMLFGGTEIERIQFNEISLWSGARTAVEGRDDEGQDLGAYQAFGDILIHLGHGFSDVTGYEANQWHDRLDPDVQAIEKLIREIEADTHPAPVQSIEGFCGGRGQP